MAVHHIALATKDIASTHAFYTEVMGFSLVKVVAAPTEGDGWAKHVFYDTGEDGLIAFWDLHDERIGTDWKPGLSRALGLPAWVNHIAFTARTLEDLEAAKQRWRRHGITVAEVDHGFCVSIYARDPNGIMVEFCCDTREFTDDDRAEADRLLFDEHPPLEPAPEPKLYPPVTADTMA